MSDVIRHVKEIVGQIRLRASDQTKQGGSCSQYSGQIVCLYPVYHPPCTSLMFPDWSCSNWNSREFITNHNYYWYYHIGNQYKECNDCPHHIMLCAHFSCSLWTGKHLWKDGYGWGKRLCPIILSLFLCVVVNWIIVNDSRKQSCFAPEENKRGWPCGRLCHGKLSFSLLLIHSELENNFSRFPFSLSQRIKLCSFDGK